METQSCTGRVAIALATLLAVVVSACAGTGDDDPVANAGLEVGTSWVLTSMTVDGAQVALIEASPVTLERTEEGISGTSACNQYGTGSQAITDRQDQPGLVFPPMFSTMMACMEPGVMELEAAYLDAMAKATSITSDGDALVISGPTATMRFAPA